MVALVVAVRVAVAVLLMAFAEVPMIRLLFVVPS